MLANRFGLSGEAGTSKAVLLEELDRILRERRQRGETTALVVDEAQSLDDELLEEIRLLANIETSDQKLLPLVLAGQPELSTRLESPRLRQFKQRVALRCEVAPFDLPETAAYIASRIRTAGGTPATLFSREGVGLIHEHSGGIPRTISVICDNALVTGMALGRQPVDRATVLEVCRDFLLGSQSSIEPIRPMPEAAVFGDPASESHAPPPDDAERLGDGQAWRARRFMLFGQRQQ